jgi:hypothetical protein
VTTAKKAKLIIQQKRPKIQEKTNDKSKQHTLLI